MAAVDASGVEVPSPLLKFLRKLTTSTVTPTKSHLEKLACVRLLLHLPGLVPFRDAKSTTCNFFNEDDVIDLGDENSAINRMLEVSFGDPAPCLQMLGMCSQVFAMISN